VKNCAAAPTTYTQIFIATLFIVAEHYNHLLAQELSPQALLVKYLIFLGDDKS
jgi:hypothetical protein